MKYGIKELSGLGKDSDKKNRLAGIVQGITEEIRSYGNDSDLELLEKVTQLCINSKMDRETSVMYRNLGKYHYYKNQTSKAFASMKKALAIAGKDELKDLSISCLSEMGLLYFYELKYDEAKRAYSKAKRLLEKAENRDGAAAFTLYYRSGVLHNYMGKYDQAFRLFKKAWDYAAEGVDKGRVLMNMGVNRKRRGMFKEAERYYKKALEIFEAEDAIQKCDIYNNMAELYKVTGNYGKAMEYILKALIYLDSRDIQRYFVYFHTYIEIKILKGEVSQYLEILITLLSNVQRHFVHKCFIVEGFNTACSIIPEEKSVLKHLRQELAEAIETTACDNEDYKNELVKCLADVCLSLKLLKSY